MVAELKTEKQSWTYSELLALDDERRIELYDGEIFEMGSPTLWHQGLILRLAMLLELWARENNAGKVYLSPVDLYISERQFLIPDLCFYTRERMENERIEREDGRCLVAPPDLVVEIISPSSVLNDRSRKTKIYADFGVRNYWIIEPELKTIDAFALENNRYWLAGSFTEEDTLESALFPGLQISLAALFQH